MKVDFYMEGWVSGLNQQFAKLPTGYTVREFESRSLRKSDSELKSYFIGLKILLKIKSSCSSQH